MDEGQDRGTKELKLLRGPKCREEHLGYNYQVVVLFIAHCTFLLIVFSPRMTHDVCFF